MSARWRSNNDESSLFSADVKSRYDFLYESILNVYLNFRLNIIKKTHIFPLLIYSQNETFLLFSITAIAHSFSLHSHQNEIYTFCCVFTRSSRALYTQRIIELFLCFDTRAMHFGGPKHTKFEMHFSYNSSTIYFERMCTTFSNGMCAANRLRM